ncbi:hypothetical protein RJT34_11910 [Clitoria ternatea]|uniref:Uncharacterized protein n=1 Tax=Clitoria ternatea TaxID=43366 RepID=A0AAN9PKG6_CLITE
MKCSLHVADTPKFLTSLSINDTNINHSLVPCKISPSNVTMPSLVAKVRTLSFYWPKDTSCVVQREEGSNRFVVGCAKWGMERGLEAEEEDDEKKGKSGMGRFRHKCGERKEVVELLECLEREAIMGEDVGKEPTDYNRRAQIFDRSSQVFQALKELNNQ